MRHAGQTRAISTVALSNTAPTPLGTLCQRIVQCFMTVKDSHHRGAAGKPGLLSHLKRPHGIVVLAILVFGAAWLAWTFVVL